MGEVSDASLADLMIGFSSHFPIFTHLTHLDAFFLKCPRLLIFFLSPALRKLSVYFNEDPDEDDIYPGTIDIKAEDAFRQVLSYLSNLRRISLLGARDITSVIASLGSFRNLEHVQVHSEPGTLPTLHQIHWKLHGVDLPFPSLKHLEISSWTLDGMVHLVKVLPLGVHWLQVHFQTTTDPDRVLITRLISDLERLDNLRYLHIADILSLKETPTTMPSSLLLPIKSLPDLEWVIIRAPHVIFNDEQGVSRLFDAWSDLRTLDLGNRSREIACNVQLPRISILEDLSTSYPDLTRLTISLDASSHFIPSNWSERKSPRSSIKHPSFGFSPIDKPTDAAQYLSHLLPFKWTTDKGIGCCVSGRYGRTEEEDVMWQEVTK